MKKAKLQLAIEKHNYAPELAKLIVNGKVVKKAKIKSSGKILESYDLAPIWMDCAKPTKEWYTKVTNLLELQF